MPGVRIFPNTNLDVLFVGAWRSRSRIGARVSLGTSVLVTSRKHRDETQQRDKGH
jgi:hypothetical protein